MPLHRRDQQRDEWLQPLSADPVTRFPEHDQRLAHRVVVNAAFRSGPRPVHDMVAAQERFSMLAVISGNLCEFRQDSTLLGPGRSTVSRRHGLQKFVSRSHADPPHACPP